MTDQMMPADILAQAIMNRNSGLLRAIEGLNRTLAPFSEMTKAIDQLIYPSRRMAEAMQPCIGLSNRLAELAFATSPLQKYIESISVPNDRLLQQLQVLMAPTQKIAATVEAFRLPFERLTLATNAWSTPSLDSLLSADSPERSLLSDLAADLNESIADDQVNGEEAASAIERLIRGVLAYVLRLPRPTIGLDHARFVAELVTISITVWIFYQSQADQEANLQAINRMSETIEEGLAKLSIHPAQYRVLERVHLRVGQDTESDSITVLDIGTTVTLVSSHGDWLLISLHSPDSSSTLTGFVAAKYLAFIPLNQ